MNTTMQTLETTVRIADTAVRISMYPWNTKSLIKLAIVATVLIGTAATINSVRNKQKEDDAD